MSRSTFHVPEYVVPSITVEISPSFLRVIVKPGRTVPLGRRLGLVVGTFD